ncbi:MAG: hypothetical protein RMK89_10485 [Armatimonadota bacterium]|nr:hypothetical protein [Armatimonadota bacterium]MDW8143876.1 hypothetical protein [Armatimonadota bacterium]
MRLQEVALWKSLSPLFFVHCLKQVTAEAGQVKARRFQKPALAGFILLCRAGFHILPTISSSAQYKTAPYKRRFWGVGSAFAPRHFAKFFGLSETQIDLGRTRALKLKTFSPQAATKVVVNFVLSSNENFGR